VAPVQARRSQSGRTRCRGDGKSRSHGVGVGRLRRRSVGAATTSVGSGLILQSAITHSTTPCARRRQKALGLSAGLDNARGICSWLMHLHLGSHWPKALLYPTSIHSKHPSSSALFSPPNAHHHYPSPVMQSGTRRARRTAQRPQQHDMAWRRLLVASSQRGSRTRDNTAAPPPQCHVALRLAWARAHNNMSRCG
jgi:hypothetical protein